MNERILIVEDDPAISKLLHTNLTISGYQTVCAMDGRQALEAICNAAFDLALCDIMLPELDGFELLPFMQEKHIPVIYVSAKADVQSRVQGLRLGAEDYLVKPFDILELLVRMLRFSETLLQAYALKEAFYHFMNVQSSMDASALLKEWFEAYDRLKLPEFKACYRMLRNRKPYILNAFDVHFSNGFTEGCNNATKTLKRVSFGIPNFNHLRTRILLANQPYPNI